MRQRHAGKGEQPTLSWPSHSTGTLERAESAAVRILHSLVVPAMGEESIGAQTQKGAVGVGVCVCQRKEHNPVHLLHSKQDNWNRPLKLTHFIPKCRGHDPEGQKLPQGWS